MLCEQQQKNTKATCWDQINIKMLLKCLSSLLCLSLTNHLPQNSPWSIKCCPQHERNAYICNDSPHESWYRTTTKHRAGFQKHLSHASFKYWPRLLLLTKESALMAQKSIILLWKRVRHSNANHLQQFGFRFLPQAVGMVNKQKLNRI